MADQKTDEKFSKAHQYELMELNFYRLADDGTVPEKTLWTDLSPMMEEMNVYEDIMAGSLTAQLMLADAFNLPDRLPILGGERVRIRFKTPSFKDEINITMVIYKVGERIFSASDNQKAQMYWLYLCTEDGWDDAQMDLSFGIKTTYDGLIQNCLSDKLKTTRKVDLEKTLGIVSYVAPYWSPLKICSFAASRARTENGDPMFFWETTEGYQLKSLKTIYAQSPQKKIFIQPKNTSVNMDQVQNTFNSVTNWNYAKSDDKLTQNKAGSFGTSVYYLDTLTWNINLGAVTKADIEINRIDKFPIVDSPSKFRSKTTSVLTLHDGSDQTVVVRDAVLDRIDNKRIVVELPGDSEVHAGQLMDLDVPSMTASAEYIKERVASGKFLVASVKHILVRDRYRMNLELLKDATEVRVP